MIAADRPPRRWIGALGVASFVLVWHLLALRIDSASTLATPVAVLLAFVSMLHEPFAGSTLGFHLLASLRRFGSGFGLAVLLGIPLGVAMGWFRTLDAAVKPAFDLLRFIAPIAWVPFAVLWFGTGFGGPVLIIFTGAFPACVIGAYGGAKLVDGRLLEAARMLGARSGRILLEVVVPSAMPAIVAALRVAAGNAWQSLVGAELIVATSGLAYIMVRGQMNRTIVIVLVGMLAIGLVGLVLEWLFRHFERYVKRRLGSAAA
ncbi:MAG: ABC transporter permease [Gammaproteobacteria bacterium]|nr:ABC transporter permease [Gammaproteobacteria bacterium]MBU1441046.1 ABC transporter permease [Gammaproteobacteria bacterium]MBU2285115.1 ABC transporter permease [Gammaproteobacteria bacterium]MBU2408734.1 ABC transporter permease [Gammaproteobacteria bacterium]